MEEALCLKKFCQSCLIINVAYQKSVVEIVNRLLHIASNQPPSVTRDESGISGTVFTKNAKSTNPAKPYGIDNESRNSQISMDPEPEGKQRAKRHNV